MPLELRLNNSSAKDKALNSKLPPPILPKTDSAPEKTILSPLEQGVEPLVEIIVNNTKPLFKALAVLTGFNQLFITYYLRLLLRLKNTCSKVAGAFRPVCISLSAL